MKTGIPVLEVRNIHKFFPGVHALKGVHFDLYPGEVHALVGENGAGKSTLIKVLSGVYRCDEGEYRIEGAPADICQPLDAIQKGISVIYQELNSVYTLSAAENIFFGRLPAKHGCVQWKQLYADTQRCLEQVGLNIKPQARLQHLNVAQQQLVEIAKAISLNAKIIIMDEPTSALSPMEIQYLFKVIRSLRDAGVAVLYISHKLDEIFALSDRITVFRDGAVVDTAYANDLTPDQLIGMMVGRKMTDMFPPKDRHAGDVTLEVRGLTSEKVDDLNFTVRKGEIVGFSGLMGAGRTEMTRALFGIDERLAGDILLDGQPLAKNDPAGARKAGIGLVTENRKEQGVFPNLSVAKNSVIATLDQLARGYVIDSAREMRATQHMVEAISIKTPSLNQLITKLSGGNQQKVLLARWLLKQNLKLMIIDEPTRGIDVGAKAEIYSLMNALAKQGMSILIVSSELPEILGMCDRIYVMKNGRITGEFTAEDADEKSLLAKAIT
ncbi:sugar ABC transporter ATP-binding protein [Bacillota bacterium Meth-B3]